jgi:hypothetical protein
MPEYYTPRDLALSVGQSEWTMRAFLRERFPGRDRAWWRFSRDEFLLLCEELSRTDGKRRRGGLRHRRTTSDVIRSCDCGIAE